MKSPARASIAAGRKSATTGQRKLAALLRPLAVRSCSEGRRIIRPTPRRSLRPRRRASDQRGPKASATQPTIGAPIGVPPRAIAEPDRHHPAAHGRLGRQLHQAVGGGGEGQGRDADDHQGDAEQPVVRHHAPPGRSRARKTPRRRSAAARSAAGPGRAASSAPVDRPDRHDRGQQTELAGAAHERP